MDEARRRRLGAWYTPAHLSATLASRTLAPVAQGAAVVDLACGDGALLHAAVAQGHFNLTGFDIDAAAVSQARQRLPQARVEVADGLLQPLDPPDAVLGNPPFLSGADRPAIDTSRFALARGQWDMAWLFLERGLAMLRPGGRFGFVLPDAVLARHETQHVRDHVFHQASEIFIQHDPPSFPGAHVATVLLWGTKGADNPTLQMDGETFTLRPGSLWPPLPRTPASWEWLGDHVRISRGEELGKRNLRRVEEGQGVPLVTGDGVGNLQQARATHCAPKEQIRKPDALFQAPKVVVVKTGRRLRAGIDLHGLRTLQSVYNVQPCKPDPTWTLCLCGLMASEQVHQRFIDPYTRSKKVFPQITQRMLSEIRFPMPPPGVAAQMARAVTQADQAAIDDIVQQWFAAGCEDADVDL